MTGVPAEASPRVSVVIPCYNGVGTLGETLDSLLAQTCKDWEALVVDDGSTDGSASVVADYANRDPRIQGLRQPRNQGVCVARNTGIRKARGPYLKFLDADDLLQPQALAVMVAACEARPDCAGVYGSWIVRYPDGSTRVEEAAEEAAVSFPALCVRNRIHLPTVMIRAEALRQAGILFDGAMPMDALGCEDWDLWIRLYRSGCRLARVREALVVYRESPSGLSKDWTRHWRSGCLVLDAASRADPERCPRSLPVFRDGLAEADKQKAYLQWNAEHLRDAIGANDQDSLVRLLDAIRVKGLPVPPPTLMAEALVAGVQARPGGLRRLDRDWRAFGRWVCAAAGLIGRAVGTRTYGVDLLYLMALGMPSGVDRRPLLRTLRRRGGLGWLEYRRRCHVEGRRLARTTGESLAILCDWPPYPVRSGDNRRVAEMIEVLRRRGWRVHLVMTRPVFALRDRRQCRRNVDRLFMFWGRRPSQYRYYAYRLAVGAANAVLSRLGLPHLQDLRRRLRGKRWSVKQEKFSALPEYPAGLERYLGRLCRRHRWNTVIVSFLWLHRAIEQLPGTTRRLIDTIDLQHKRQQEFEAHGLAAPLTITREEEAAILRRFDGVLAIQREEAAHIRAMCPEVPVVTVGTSTQPRVLPSAVPQPGRLLYVGGSNAANVHGMRRFLEASWPRIRAARPDAFLRVCGFIYHAFVNDAFPNVRFMGHVEDLEEEYALADVVINPIWIGTGLKIKTVEAVARGKPVVTTTKGIEGMEGDARSVCAITDTSAELAERIIAVLSDGEIRETLAEQARAYARRYLAPEAIYAELLTLLEAGPSLPEATAKDARA